MTNRRGPTRVFAGRLPTICLLVIITTSTSVSAFSFWSSSMLGKVIKPQALLTRPTQAAAATQQSTGARHSQITTTSSTTTTTTQMPLQPLELHFEINPEGLTYERGDGPEVAWNKTSEELSSSSAIANGSLILEDLVNQFARNFQAGELKFRSASNKTVDNLSEFAAEPTTPQMSMQLLDEPNHVDHSTSDPDADGRPTVTSSFEPTSHDSLVEPPAEEPDPDRHIQYDMTNLFTNVDSATSAATTHQALQAHDRSANSSASTDVRFAGQDSNQTRRQPSPPTLTVSHILTNVTIPTQTTTTTAQGAHHPPERRNHLLSSSSLENDTSILDTAMSSNSSRAPATTNLLQARSMSPGSSGHLSSLSNHRPPPVVGQKPPYASSYQLHHRNAIGPSDFVSRDASQNSSYGQVAPPLQKRQDQMASATTTNGELTNSINSISSSLLISDSQQSSQTTTSTTTTAKPPPHAGLAQTLQNYLAATAASDNYAGFSERQDNERAEELERVANKLAPSELTELNPIESPSLMNSAHQLHYQPDQVFPADIGSSPADSNSVIVSNYHHSAADHHYTPQLASSGLSEPANSMSSYLQAQQRQQSGSVDTTSGGELNKRAHDAKGGAPAAGLASTTTTTTSGNDGRDDRVNSPQVQVHRRTIETLSNQIAHADGNLAASANTLAVHQHRERSPPSAHDGRGVPNSNYHNHQHQGNSYAASLINVTAPMVLPLSATEAMEAALSDPAARQMMHHVGGGSLTLMQAGDQDQRYSSAAHAQTTTPPPQRSSYYVIPPPPSDHTTGGGGLHHLSIYSRAPAQNQFRPGASATTSSTTPASSTAGGDTQSPYELERERMRLGDGGYLLQQQAQVAPGSQQASGFRSPFGQYPASVTAATAHMLSPGAASAGVPTPSSYLSGMSAPSSTSSPQSGNKFVSSTPASIISTTNATSASTSGGSLNRFAPDRKQQMMNSSMATTTNGFITSGISNSSSSGSTSLAGIVVSTASSDMATAGTGSQQQTVGQVSSQQPTGGSGGGGSGLGKRVFNLTRVEHISAECSNDLIRTIIIFNGTFKGIIYSSGYVRDSNCLYVNGTGKTRYDFSIKLNQCGTLGRQEIHPAGGGPGGDGLRRRDQVMWNTLSIQYNPIIEQEWDEHFRVSCEYGSDFWKTISFSPFNVETNTGSPVVFTVDPPQCQMEILKGHGMVGPRQETITGPVTVGDPLTLLIHMKSEKAGYDILVKNCVAHNGGQQKMQLIDTNGCVVNERFISPFRGTYNDNDLKHVTLYSYLKAFRFTGSPVLYLECEVHMCQSACPPQMCYWRRLSKRSTSGGHLKSPTNNTIGLLEPYDDHSSLEEFDVSHGHSTNRDMDSLDDDHEGATTHLGQSQYVKTIRFNATASTTTEGPPSTRRQASRQSTRQGRGLRSQEGDKGDKKIGQDKRQENLSDSISLFQALEVRQEREDPNTSGESGSALASQRSLSSSGGSSDLYEITGISNSGDASQLMCYQRIEIFAFLFTVASILLAALSVTIGCYYRASSLRRVSLAASSAAHQHHYDHHHQRALGRSKQRHLLAGPPTHPGRISGSLSLSSANMCYSPFSSSSVSSSTSPSACSPTSCESSGASPPGNHSAITGRANYLLLDQNLHFNPAASSHGRDGGGATLATNNRLQQQQPGGNNINLNEIGAALRSLHHLAAPQPTKRQPGL